MFAIDLGLPILLTTLSLIGVGYYYLLHQQEKATKVFKATIQSIFFLVALQFFFLGADAILGIFVQGGADSAYDQAMQINQEVQFSVMVSYGAVLIAWTAASVILSLVSFGVLDTANRELLAPAIWSSVSALIDLNNQLVLQYWTLWVFQRIAPILISFGAVLAALTIIESERLGYAICLNVLAAYVAIPIGIIYGYDTLMQFNAEHLGMMLTLSSNPLTMPAAILIHQATMIWLPGIIIGFILMVSGEIIARQTGERRASVIGFLQGIISKS